LVTARPLKVLPLSSWRREAQPGCLRNEGSYHGLGRRRDFGSRYLLGGLGWRTFAHEDTERLGSSVIIVNIPGFKPVNESVIAMVGVKSVGAIWHSHGVCTGRAATGSPVSE